MNWNLPEIRGSRDACKQKLAAVKDEKKPLPQPVKDFIVAQIDSMPKEVTNCVITGYSQDADNRSAYAVTRNINITVVGLRL